MKKSVVVIAGVAILAGAWLGATWYTGKKLETETTARIALANEQLAQIDPSVDLVLSQVSYERGFFRSHARYALTVAEKGEEPDARVEFDARYEHGPFPAGALAQGRFMPTLAFVHSELVKTNDSETWFEIAQGKVPLTSDVLLSYSGDAQFDVSFAPLNMEGGEDAFNFSGASLKGDFKAKNQHAIGTFQAASMTMDVETTDAGRLAMTLADAQMDFDTRNNAFGIQSGDVELRVKRMVIHPEYGAEVAIDQLVYGGKSTEDDTFMQGEVYLNTGSVAVDGQALGSQSMVFKLDRLDGKALKLVSDAYNRLAVQLNSEDTLDGNMDELMQAAKALLDANPTLALDDFNWTTDKGRSTLSMHSEWQAPADLAVPEAVLLAQAVKTVRMDLSLNKPMATDLTAKLMQVSEGLDAQEAETQATRQVEESLAALGSLGLFKEDGDMFNSRVEFDGNKVTINGEDVPPEVLLGLMLAM